jgi:hypothetical protein
MQQAPLVVVLLGHAQGLIQGSHRFLRLLDGRANDG